MELNRRPKFLGMNFRRKLINNKSLNFKLTTTEKVSQARNSRAIKESLAAFPISYARLFYLLCSPKMAQNNKRSKRNYNIIKCFHAKQMIHHSTVLVSSCSLKSSKNFFSFVSNHSKMNKAETKDQNRSPPTSLCAASLVCCFWPHIKNLFFFFDPQININNFSFSSRVNRLSCYLMFP